MLALALLATLGLAGAAAPQPTASAPSPAAAPSPRASALAHQIYEAIGGGVQVQAAAARLMAPMLKQLPAAPVNGKDMRADMSAFIGTELTKYRPQMGEITERAYAETFSEAELQGLLTFYQSPVGRAYVGKLPDLSGRTAVLMTPVYVQIRRDTLSHICDVTNCSPDQRAAMTKLAGGG